MEPTQKIKDSVFSFLGSIKESSVNYYEEIINSKKLTSKLEEDIKVLKEQHKLEMKMLSEKHEAEKKELQEKLDARFPSGDHAKDIFSIHKWLLAYAQWLASKKMNYDDSLSIESKTIAKELKAAHVELFRLINNIEDVYKLRKAEAPTDAEFEERLILEELFENERRIDEENKAKLRR